MQPVNKFFKDYRKMFRLLKEGETFTAFDTETTGLSSQNCRIIEIGAVSFNSSGIIKTYNTLINPKTQIPPELVKLTHISDEMVQDKPFIEDILPDFLNFIDSSIIVAHNAQFDLRFLNAELKRSGLDESKNAVIDTLGFARWCMPDLPKYNQPFLAQMFGIDVSACHRAYDDARVCGNIFLELIKKSADRQRM